MATLDLSKDLVINGVGPEKSEGTPGDRGAPVGAEKAKGTNRRGTSHGRHSPVKDGDNGQEDTPMETKGNKKANFTKTEMGNGKATKVTKR